jgi:hypothetical protein
MGRLSLAVVAALWLGAGSSLAQAPKPAAAPTAAAAAAPAAGGGVWKNLQVLPKDIAKPALKAQMKQMSKELGVECDHCHKEPDMAEDTDKKKTAREMMEMVKTINAKYPMTMKKVTCWTCHRGKSVPDKTPGSK